VVKVDCVLVASMPMQLNYGQISQSVRAYKLRNYPTTRAVPLCVATFVEQISCGEISSRSVGQ